MTTSARMLAAASLWLALAGQAPPPPAAPAPPAPAGVPERPLTPEEAFIAQRMAALPPARGIEGADLYVPARPVPGGRGGLLPTTTPDAAGIAPEAIEAAAAWAEARGSFALIIARDGGVVAQRYWSGHGPRSRFATASMHKTVMALAYGPAIAEGRIRLGDPVGRHLPEWRADPRGAITIGQLLRMESGLGWPPQPGPPGPGSPIMRIMFAPDIRAVALETPVAAPPGSRFAYANVDSQLAGEALAAAVGGDYAAWLSERIWKPIGAADASLFLDREGGSPHFFCCLQATPMDWVRVGELIRNQGRVRGRQVVPADWIAAMARGSALNPNFGMQLWRGSPHAPVRRYSAAAALTVPAREPFARDDVLFLDGAGGQRVYVVPSERMTIVRIGRPSPDWDDSALVNLVLGGLRPPAG
jgi:CubicO group peptidase (beta-lactamase class C family)